ncbi:MAG: 2-C-methyl-D-erythritol 4-phosphate cytidylyltransferase [Blastocatellia bacterium]
MNVAIIPAAGSGSRFGGETPKQFLLMGGEPVLLQTLRRFDLCPEIDGTIVALPESALESWRERLAVSGLAKPVRLVPGGRERSDSIRHALEAAAQWSPDGQLPEIVAVHDAVRPLVTPTQIALVVQRAREVGAAILALASTDTLKEVEDGLIVRTLDRRRIYRAQTPQAFHYSLLVRANQVARESNLPSAATTDDALLVEALGVPVAIVEGSSHNLKITTPEDLRLAERLLQEEAASYRFSSEYA